MAFPSAYLNHIKMTINKNANFATKLFESKKLLFDEFPLVVENEL